MSMRNTCGHLDIQRYQYSPVPANVKTHLDVFVRDGILGCTIDTEPLLKANLASFLSGDVFGAEEHSGEPC